MTELLTVVALDATLIFAPFINRVLLVTIQSVFSSAQASRVFARIAVNPFVPPLLPPPQAFADTNYTEDLPDIVFPVET